jgi:hypothetical protein
VLLCHAVLLDRHGVVGVLPERPADGLHVGLVAVRADLGPVQDAGAQVGGEGVGVRGGTLAGQVYPSSESRRDEEDGAG